MTTDHQALGQKVPFMDRIFPMTTLETVWSALTLTPQLLSHSHLRPGRSPKGGKSWASSPGSQPLQTNPGPAASSLHPAGRGQMLLLALTIYTHTYLCALEAPIN